MADQLQQVEGQVETDVLAAGRSACYKVRDQFYECIEKTKSTPTEVASVGLLYPKECKSSRIEYEKKCRPTWEMACELGFPDAHAMDLHKYGDSDQICSTPIITVLKNSYWYTHNKEHTLLNKRYKNLPYHAYPKPKFDRPSLPLEEYTR